MFGMHEFIVFAIALAIVTLGTVLYFKYSGRSGRLSGKREQDWVEPKLVMQRRGNLETGMPVVVLAVSRFGDVLDRGIGCGEILGFTYKGRTVIRMDSGAIVRRKDYRLVPLNTN